MVDDLAIILSYDVRWEETQSVFAESLYTLLHKDSVDICVHVRWILSQAHSSNLEMWGCFWSTIVEGRSYQVTDDGKPVRLLNELEWINNEIWANIWMTDCIARIDPISGNVNAWVMLQVIVFSTDTYCHPCWCLVYQQGLRPVHIPTISAHCICSCAMWHPSTSELASVILRLRSICARRQSHLYFIKRESSTKHQSLWII